MNIARLVALACGSLAATAIAAGPLDGFRGKIKEGMYEYKMDMDMGNMPPGMPAGMGKQSHSFQKCVTAQDIEKGEMGRDARSKGPGDCEMKDAKMSGNTATYKMVCKEGTTMDVTMTSRGDGFVMDNKMAMNQRGQMMNMNQHIEGKYLGPCK